MSAQAMAAWAGFGLTILINLALAAYWVGKRQREAESNSDRIAALEQQTVQIQQNQHELRNLLVAFMLGLEEVPADIDDPNKLLRLIARARSHRSQGEARA